VSPSLDDSDQQLEIRHLLSALCDGEITDDEHNRLESLMFADERCRRIYLQYLELHSALLLAGKDNVLLPYSSKDDFVCDINATATMTPEAARQETPTSRGTIAYRYFLVAVATLVVTVMIQVFWWQPADVQKTVTPPAKNIPETVTYVATLREMVDCVWEKPETEMQSGARLKPGDIHLPKGVAYVQFDSGPEIVVEGPAELRLDSSTAVTLLSGKVVLRADESAAPFDLHTPMSTFAEIGTEFAIAVTKDTEEIHVFEGEVRRTPKVETVSNKAENLKAGEARHYVAKSLYAGKPTPCDPKKFVRHIAGKSGVLGDLWAYEGFDYRSPNQLMMGKANGGFGWFGPWKAGFTRPGENEPPRFALNLREGLSRPEAAIPAVGGSFDYSGFTTASRRMARPIRLDADGTFYVSYLVRRHGPPADPFNAAAIMLWTHDDFMQQKFENARQRLFIGLKKANQLTARLQRMDAQTTLAINSSETMFLVAKITASGSGSDQVFIRAYGPNDVVDSSDPSSWTLTSTPFQSDLSFDWLQLHINSKTRHTLDEVRVGTTWPAVTSAYQRRLRI
jgi:hypothetical protein